MEIKVTFQPEGREVYVLSGTLIMEAAARAGLVLDSPCGGRGVCGKCLVEVQEGKLKPSTGEKKSIPREDLKKGVRLACQARIIAPVLIYIPSSSRFSAQRILTAGWEERKVELAGPGEEKGDRGDYGLAFDLGTTTLVGTILHTASGRELAISSRMNPQAIYGDDVISRVSFIKNSSEGLEELHRQVMGAVNEMVDELAEGAKVKRENIQRMTVAGNSIMQHLFLKVSPESLGSLPFSLVVKEGVEIKAQELGVRINPKGVIFIFPNIAGFVGGDTVAVILAAGLFQSEEVKLIVDIGTNGEIVLGNRKRLLVASTAAGPAFEGARISQGMRASPGAVEKVVINEEVEINVVGDIPSSGVCGSGLIDAVAELLKVGIIDKSGKITSRSALQGKISDGLLHRVIEEGTNSKFLLLEGALAHNKHPLFITQKDVRELQLAKGAIAAGIKILQKELGIEDEDIAQILLAGAFGNFIRRRQAKRIGLIPNLPSERIKFIGNAASSGAKLALLSQELRKEAETISRETEYIELSGQPDFQEEFAQAMSF